MKTLAALAVKACNQIGQSRFRRHFVLCLFRCKRPVGQNGRGVLKVAEQLEDLQVLSRQLFFIGARHEILNENDRDMVYKDVLAWAYEAMN